MGYSCYFYKVPKSLIADLKNCVTDKEVITVCKSHGLTVKEFDDEFFCPPYDWGNEVYDFGKSCDCITSIESTGTPLFKPGTEAASAYVDYAVHIANKESIKCAIECYRDKVRNIYNDLLQEQSSDIWDKRSQFDRMLAHIQDYAYNWNYAEVYDLKESHERLVNDWLYEHTIFDLVRIYKTFDFNESELIFFGY